MKLIVRCHYCKQETRINYWATDRGHLARENGDEISAECLNCEKKGMYGVNAVRAQPRKLVAIIALATFVFGTLAFFLFLKPYLFLSNSPHNTLAIASVLMIPLFIFILLGRQEWNKVYRFNSYRV